MPGTIIRIGKKEVLTQDGSLSALEAENIKHFQECL